MTSGLAELQQADFSAGTFRSVDRRLIPENGCWDIINGLLNDDGSVYRRGGVTYQSTAFSGSGLRWIWESIFSAGRRTLFANTADFGVLGADDQTPVNLGGSGLAAPVRAAQVGDLLFIDGGTVYAGSRRTSGYSTGTVAVTQGSPTVTGTGTLWSANVDAGSLFNIGGNRYYVVQSVGGNTTLTLSETYAGSTVSGSAYATVPLGTADVANGRGRSSSSYAAVASRLVTGEGRKVWISDSLNPDTGYSQPQVFQETSNHELPNGAEVIGIAAIGTKALVFSTQGLFAITNLAFDIVDTLGNQQHAVQTLGQDLVLWGKAGIASWQQSVVAPCTDGVYLLDGTSQPQLITRSITPLLSDYQRQGLQPGGATVYRNHYFLPVLDASAAVVDMLVCRLDRATQTRVGLVFPWARWDGFGGNMTSLVTRIGVSDAARAPVLLGANNSTNGRVCNMSSTFTPDVPYAQDADDTTHEFDLVTRDYPLNEVPDLVRRIHLDYVLTGLDVEDPHVLCSYAVGPEVIQGSGALWDVMLWDADSWTGTVGGEFRALEGDAPRDDGRNAWTWTLESHTKTVRYRFLSSGSPAILTLRGITTVHRQNRSAI